MRGLRFRKPRSESDRKAHEHYARTHGFFWLPCPVCNEWFGGHEEGGGHAKYIAPVPTPVGSSTSTCPRCPGTWHISSDQVPSEGFWDARPVHSIE